MSTFCGTTTYIAPELLTSSDARHYTRKVDMWSFGVVMFAWWVQDAGIEC